MDTPPLGTTIRILRELQGIGIRQLAREVESAPSNILNIETGKIANPSVFLVQRIAGALNVTVDDLLSGNTGYLPCPACEGKGYIKDQSK